MLPANGGDTKRGLLDIKAWLNRAFRQMLLQTVPIVECVRIEYQQKREIARQEQSTDLTEEMQKHMVLPIEELKEAHELEIKRRAQVQDRVKANAGTITVTTTLVLAALAISIQRTVEPSTGDQWSWQTNVLFVLTVGSLVLSGLSAVRAIATSKICDNWLQMRIAPFGMESPQDDEKARFIRMIHLNQRYNGIITNYASASYTGLRNAFILLIPLVVTAMIW